MRRPLRLSDIRADTRLVHWYVIFTEPSKRRFWDQWLRPGFGHCYAMRWDGFNWLIVNPRSDWLQVDVSAVCDHNQRDAAIGDCSAVLGVMAAIPRDRVRSRFFAGPVTCVEIVKALLGIRAFFVFTPWQLFNYLRARHGTV